MLGRTEEPDTGMLCPQKRTSGTSCDTEGWIWLSMHPWDLSWQTSPRIWSVARFVSKLTFWTWAAWWSRSELEDLIWDAPQGHYVSGWTLRYALAGDRRTLKHTRWRGWQNGLPRTPKGNGHSKMRCWLLHFGGGGGGGVGGKSSLAWALGHQVFFPAAFLEIITVFRFVLHFEGCGWACFPCPHYLGGRTHILKLVVACSPYLFSL